MSWTTALVDLRTLLSDGPTDKYRWRKPVFPAPNGALTSFKTFEYRRITDLTTPTAPLGVYVNSLPVPVTSDDPATGEFIITTAPNDGDKIEVSYYVQWFLDSELTSFIISASQWLLLGSDFTQVEEGLRPAAIKFAASEAYLKLALRWSERQSEMYRVEDAQDPKNKDALKGFTDLAEYFKGEASKLRDERYTRSGQPLAPIFSTIRGRARSTTPRD